MKLRWLVNVDGRVLQYEKPCVNKDVFKTVSLATEWVDVPEVRTREMILANSGSEGVEEYKKRMGIK